MRFTLLAACWLLSVGFVSADEQPLVDFYDLPHPDVTFGKETASWMGCRYPVEFVISPMLAYDREVQKELFRLGKISPKKLLEVKESNRKIFRVSFTERFPVDDPIWSKIIAGATSLKETDKWSSVVVVISADGLTALEVKLLSARMNRALNKVGKVFFLGECIWIQPSSDGKEFRATGLGQRDRPIKEVWPYLRNLKQDLGALPPIFIGMVSIWASVDKDFWINPPSDLQIPAILHERHYIPIWSRDSLEGPIIDPQEFLNKFILETDRKS